VLHFPDLHVKGNEGRVSIFVGPENVALYKNEDVINWASAFKSFTGEAYPLPIVCPSNEVLVVFKTDAHNAVNSKLTMTWGPASAKEVIAKESLAILTASSVVPGAPGKQQVLVEKPLVVVHHDLPTTHDTPKTHAPHIVAVKMAPKVAVKMEKQKRATFTSAQKIVVMERKIAAKKAPVVVHSAVEKKSVVGHTSVVGDKVKNAAKRVARKATVVAGKVFVARILAEKKVAVASKKSVARTAVEKKTVAVAQLQTKAKVLKAKSIDRIEKK